MKKILIISQYFPPDISGGGTRAYNYAKCLSKNYDVTVITAFPHLHSKIPSAYSSHLIKKEKIDKIKVTNQIGIIVCFFLPNPNCLIVPSVLYKNEGSSF